MLGRSRMTGGKQRLTLTVFLIFLDYCRTARGHSAGVSLSLVCTKRDEAALVATQQLLKGVDDDVDPLKPCVMRLEKCPRKISLSRP